MVTKRFLIRCDSSALVGSGHVMRCLSLAEKLRASGIQVEFASRDLPYNINNEIEKKQFKLWQLKAPSKEYGDFLDVKRSEELSEINNLLDSEKFDWVIVDNYALGLEWETQIKGKGKKLLVIDDIFRAHDCTYLLDQNLHMEHAQTWKRKANAEKLFLGPEFALLSDDFLKIQPRLRNGNVHNVLAFFGGSDLAKGSEMFLDAWSKIQLTNVKAKLVIGKSNPRKDQMVKNDIENLEIVIASDDFPKWLSNTDLFVGAGGTTTWERCYLGVPGLVVSIAENQSEIAQNLHAQNIHEFLGEIEKINSSILENELRSLISDNKKRKDFSENSLQLKVASKLPQLVSSLNI